MKNMNPGMRVFCSLSCVLAVLSLPASVSAAGAGVEKRYALSERGFFKLTVPAGWTDRIEQKSQAAPPLITFGPGQGKPFIVSVTPMWQTGAGKPELSKEELRKRVEYEAEGIRMFAVEKDIKLKEFAGASGPGFYFFATDQAPKPGEYKFMTRGELKVGDLSVAFTILTNVGQDEVVRAALEMLKGAAHLPQ
jgi:hypothetical protein